MTDDATKPSNGAGSPPGAQPPGPPPLVINAQYVKDFSFENPNAPEILRELGDQPERQMNVHVQSRPMGENVHEVSLTMNVEARYKEKALYIVELVFAGIFTLNGVPPEAVQPILLIECPRHLFPYARSLMASIVADSGMPPLQIPIVNFAELYQYQSQAQPQAAPPATQTA